MAPVRTGIAFAITVGVFYAMCTLIWVLAPGSFLTFMNNLFHGMDFTALVQSGAFDWSGFVTALLILSWLGTGSRDILRVVVTLFRPLSSSTTAPDRRPGNC